MEYGYAPEPSIKAFVTNLGKYNEGELVGEWLALPATPEQVQTLFGRIGIDGRQYEEFFVTDYDTEIPGLNEHLGEYTSLDELNYLASTLDEMDTGEIEKFGAAVEYGDYTGSLKDLINLAQNLDGYDYYAGINSDEDLGYYWAEESGTYDLEQMGTLAQYIDHERFGRDIRLDEGGAFVAGGYLHSMGSSFTEYYDGMDVPEEYRVFSLPAREKDAGLEQPESVQGYEVQKSVLFSNGRGMAFAENPDEPQPFVTWQFTEENGERSFYWGHYFSGKETAKQDFSERVLDYQTSYGVKVVTQEKGKTKAEKQQPER